MSKARRPIADVIHFPVPLTTELDSKRKLTQVTTKQQAPVTSEASMSYEDRKAAFLEIRSACIREGLNEGAVVCKRYHTSNKPALIPANWGIVKSMNSYHSDPAKYRPLNVSWISPSSADSEHTKDELYIIMPAPDREELELSLMIQDEEITDVSV